jgi:hypothetical protein
MMKFVIVAAIVFAATAVLVWWAFLRPVPIATTTAEIRGKTFKPAGTYWQQQVGINRGFRTATPISVDEAYILEVYSRDIDSAGFVSIPTAEESRFQVGQQVSIEYQRRGLPLFGYRTIVLSVRPE